MSDLAKQDYSPRSLSDKYGIDAAEATRLITRFGSNRHELDLLLSARDRHVELRTRAAAVLSPT